MAIDPKLLEFATERQKEVLSAIERYGCHRKAAEALGVSRGTVSGAVASVQARAAKMGYSPSHDMTHTVPDGFRVKGTSTAYTADGIAIQWVKTERDSDRWEAIVREACAAMAESLPRVKPAAGPEKTEEAL